MGMLRHVDIVGVCFDFFACVPLLNLFVCCICLLVCCFGSIAAFIHTYPKGIAAHTHFQTILACGKGSSRARWFDVDSTLLVMVITMRGVIIKTMISYNQGWLQLIMVITTIRMKWSLSLGQWSVAIKLCCAVCNTLLRRKLHLEVGTCQTPSCVDLHHHHHSYKKIYNFSTITKLETFKCDPDIFLFSLLEIWYPSHIQFIHIWSRWPGPLAERSQGKGKDLLMQSSHLLRIQYCSGFVIDILKLHLPKSLMW